jgi:ankyrin repeat protein
MTTSITNNLAISFSSLSLSQENETVTVDSVVKALSEMISQTRSIDFDLVKTAINKFKDIARVKSLVLQLSEIVDSKGDTLLMKVCDEGDEELAIALINLGASITATNNEYQTPLHRACYSNLLSVVKLLVESGANIDAVTNADMTPLLAASYNQNEEMIRYLIDKGADINCSNQSGDSPLLLACGYGTSSFIQFLLSKDANVNHCTVKCNTPLHIAIIFRKIDIVKTLLLVKELEPAKKNSSKKTPFQYIRSTLHESAIKKAVENIFKDYSKTTVDFFYYYSTHNVTKAREMAEGLSEKEVWVLSDSVKEVYPNCDIDSFLLLLGYSKNKIYIE